MSLRETLERIRSSPVPDNEETAKFRILAPILDDLSWDTSGQEVRWEHPVGGKRTGGKADIALKAEGRIWALIEAKAPGANLSQHVEQVLGYAFYEGVDICVLSDGLQWWLYLPREPGSHEERRFSVLRLDKDPVDQICNDLSTFLSRESLLGGQAVERARQVRRALREAAQLEKGMPGIWQHMLDEPDSELVELIGQRVYDRLSLRPGRGQIVAVLQNRPVPPNQPTTTMPQAPDPPSTPRPSSANKPYTVVLWGKRHPVPRFSDILITVAEELHKRHPESFEQTVEPLKVSDGKRQFVSRERLRVAGKSPRQTPSGLFVAWKFKAKLHQERWVQLLEAFGYSESDMQILYEDPRSVKPSVQSPTTRPTAVRLWGERHSVRYHKDVLMTAVSQLHERHGDNFDQTVARLKSGKSQYVAADRRSVRGTRIEQTTSGHYVDVNLSAAAIKRRAIELLEAFGYGEADLEYLYE